MTTSYFSHTKASELLLCLLFTSVVSPEASAANSASDTPAVGEQKLAATAPTPMLVPEHFNIPKQFVLPQIKLVKVAPAYAEQDYQALLAARLQIRQDLGTDWPADNLTLPENINDLNAFNQRTNFTYHLLEPASGRLIGSLYISQSSAQYQA